VRSTDAHRYKQCQGLYPTIIIRRTLIGRLLFTFRLCSFDFRQLLHKTNLVCRNLPYYSVNSVAIILRELSRCRRLRNARHYSMHDPLCVSWKAAAITRAFAYNDAQSDYGHCCSLALVGLSLSFSRCHKRRHISSFATRGNKLDARRSIQYRETIITGRFHGGIAKSLG